MEKTYTVIPDFLLDYDLSLVETVALSVIYGFCQDGKSDFHGSYTFLARKTKLTRRGIMKVISRLESKGLITKKTKEYGGVKFCSMRTNLGSEHRSPVVNTVHQGSERRSPGSGEHGSPNNIIIENKEKERVVESFVAPTLEEVKAFWKEKNYQSDPEQFWGHFYNCDWKLSNGKGAKMKSWKVAAVNWEKTELKMYPRHYAK